MPIVVNIKPPISSHFQATAKKANRTNEGVKCNKKALICCQMDRLGENESNANTLRKRIAMIHSILGNQ
jgi:hypothetical protein